MNLQKYNGDISKIDFLDLMMLDISGNIHHVSIPKGYISKKIFNEGIGFDASNFGFAHVNKSDMVAIPDMDTAFLEIKDEFNILHVLCNVEDPFTGNIFEQYPRNIVKLTQKYLKDNNIADDAKMLVELEMYVFDNVEYSTSEDHSYYSLESEEGLGDNYNLSPRMGLKKGYHGLYPKEKYFSFRNNVVSTLEKANIPVKYHHHEVGLAQLEIELNFMSLLKVADNVSLAKWIIKNIANEMGLYVTFMPKPMYKMPGNGMHVHQFLEKNGESIFTGDALHGLSETALYYTCGLLDHSLTGSLLAFTNPSTNSFRRLVPGYEAPISATFAKGSRSAAIRIPGYLKGKDIRIEYRTGDATANIYYMASAMVLAGVDGINKKESPVDKGYHSAEEKSDMIFPLNLEKVLEGLEKDKEYLLKVFPEGLIKDWIKLKKEEAAYVYNAPTPQEFELYF
ncbi:hypothetical protein OSSY52_15410 [Tepiditoga spiralis]|uniref:GS catalytic domain-containing protein n=1 Tax=Tepiditoga spiralis TaxID=2108365 RepID=A0A7G1G4H3_9BACT|nr:glutamine synthetase beta-grasp domain-containing protein [Tepiditoga spiralis]BBE31400.1 hypothetical protein OSSY52_15410 [Tepiditoga spiralis]